MKFTKTFSKYLDYDTLQRNVKPNTHALKVTDPTGKVVWYGELRITQYNSDSTRKRTLKSQAKEAGY